ncbi:complex I subunit 5 family protein [Dethiobacter alkaliphilus]|uniref:NADH dehydrogenase (Quinone) n=1 Tax=Dethiobacter alkaliphilus AHT 1 TaxID=555088 RepID=C0GJ39_DETAL|nr:proton-conducting transporter membrane subunit [Dethiobacter alkaliphilus]EEG76672.1 NADH dehydrogenase (quinone) [Dethiobacter alkaliphilus AHT 1]
MNTILWQPWAAIGVLAVSALMVWLGGEKNHKTGSALSLCSLTAAFVILVTLVKSVLAGERLGATLDMLPPFGLSIQIDLLSLSLALLFLFCGAVLALYTATYPLKQGYRRFKAIFLFILACATGVVLAGDLLTLFLFFEAMSLSFFLLVIHHRTREAVAATMKFLYMTVGGSVLYFMALAVVFVQSQNFSWQDGGFMTAGAYTSLAFVGFAIAFGMKAGMFPLHLWMADVYGQAPPPAVALSSMIMLKTGAYGMIRIFHQVFGVELIREQGWHVVILVLAIISIIYGSLCAFAERDLPRRLAYSGIAQLGYILFGISLLTSEALIGGVYHIMGHAMMKGTLLLCAGAILAKTGKRKIADLAGIGWQMPLTMSCFSFAALTAVGLPPMNIFISKWYLSLGALVNEQPLLILILLLSSVMNAAYYLPIAFTAFFGERNRDLHASLLWDRLPLGMWVSMLLLAIGSVAFGLGAENVPLNWAQNIAAAFFN